MPELGPSGSVRGRPAMGVPTAIRRASLEKDDVQADPTARGPKENVIQHRAIVRRPMARRRLQQPCNSRPAVNSLHRELECFPQLVHGHEASGSPMAIQRDTGCWRQSSESPQQAQHQQNPIEQPGGPRPRWRAWKRSSRGTCSAKRKGCPSPRSRYAVIPVARKVWQPIGTWVPRLAARRWTMRHASTRFIGFLVSMSVRPAAERKGGLLPFSPMPAALI